MRSNCGYNVLTGDQRAGVYVPPHEVYNPYETSNSRARSAGSQIVFGKAADDKYLKNSNDYNAYEETKAMPPQNNYNYTNSAVNYPPDEPTYEAPRATNKVSGVQLPISNRDYTSFQGGEGAGIGVGYSKPLQPDAPVKGFVGGAGTKFY